MKYLYMLLLSFLLTSCAQMQKEQTNNSAAVSSKTASRAPAAEKLQVKCGYVMDSELMRPKLTNLNSDTPQFNFYLNNSKNRAKSNDGSQSIEVNAPHDSVVMMVMQALENKKILCLKNYEREILEIYFKSQQ